MEIKITKTRIILTTLILGPILTFLYIILADRTLERFLPENFTWIILPIILIGTISYLIYYLDKENNNKTKIIHIVLFLITFILVCAIGIMYILYSISKAYSNIRMP